jgi:hypothetical protein
VKFFQNNMMTDKTPSLEICLAHPDTHSLSITMIHENESDLLAQTIIASVVYTLIEDCCIIHFIARERKPLSSFNANLTKTHFGDIRGVGVIDLLIHLTWAHALALSPTLRVLLPVPRALIPYFETRNFLKIKHGDTEHEEYQNLHQPVATFLRSVGILHYRSREGALMMSIIPSERQITYFPQLRGMSSFRVIKNDFTPEFSINIKYLRRAFREQEEIELQDLLPPAVKKAWIDKMKLAYVPAYNVDYMHWPDALKSSVGWYAFHDALLEGYYEYREAKDLAEDSNLMLESLLAIFALFEIKVTLNNAINHE